ncbi:MAG: TauD/TfdA family dioxygenase [Actinomycetota bacterium]
MSTTDITDPAHAPGEHVEQPGADLGADRIPLPNYPEMRIGPLGHLRTERDRLAGLRWEHFDVRPLSATIGAELSGVDLAAELADEVVAEIRQALLDFKVIFFRDQPLTPEQHVAFARRFGELEVHPFIPGNPDVPELVRFEKSADVGGYENGWHHDVTWRAEPSFGAILHAVSVPATGGDTLFSDQYAAYEGLDDDVKAEIEDLVAVHDYALAFGFGLPPDEKAKMREEYPLVEHPVVARHAETGRRHLYVNRYFTSHIVGYEPEASVDLIDRLARQAETLEYQVRFRWEPDSVAFWDNRAVQHFAASDYWPDVRVMERASILGSRPTA